MVPSPEELAEWNDRRQGQELDSLRDSLTRLVGREVKIFQKDFEDLRREKYAAQQAAKAKGAAEKSNNNGNNNNAAPAPEKEKFRPTEKKEKKKKEGNAPAAAPAANAALPGHIDIRVGKVISAAPHPDGDTLYVEQIDVGEEKPRTIVSGIREHIPLTDFVGARVLVMCNLKEKPLRGVPSNGMICCGSTVGADGKKTVRLLEVPDVAPGTRVVWGDADAPEPDAAPVSNSKLGKLLKEFKTDANGTVVWGADGLVGKAGGVVITCKELPNGVVG